MTEQDRQTLSALLDNEADELELRRLLKAAESDPDLVDHWRRYNLAQAVMLGHEVRPVSKELSRNIAAAIAGDSVPARTAWGKSTGRFAVAASVAVLVFAGLQYGLKPFQAGPANETSAVPVLAREVTVPVSPEAATASLVAVSQPVTRSVDPVALQRLEEYINQAAITHEPPTQLEYIQDSPLYHLVNETRAPLSDRQ